MNRFVLEAICSKIFDWTICNPELCLKKNFVSELVDALLNSNILEEIDFSSIDENYVCYQMHLMKGDRYEIPRKMKYDSEEEFSKNCKVLKLKDCYLVFGLPKPPSKEIIEEGHKKMKDILKFIESKPDMLDFDVTSPYCEFYYRDTVTQYCNKIRHFMDADIKLYPKLYWLFRSLKHSINWKIRDHKHLFSPEEYKWMQDIEKMFVEMISWNESFKIEGQIYSWPSEINYFKDLRYFI